MLTACNSYQSTTPTIAVVSSADTPAPLIRYTGTPTPVKCQSPPPSGLPTGEELKSTHILYMAGETIDSLNQVWAYGIKDGSSKLILSNLPFSYSRPGFLLDGFYIVLVNKGNFWLSDLSRSSPNLIETTSPDYQSLLAGFPKNSKIWKIYNGINDTQSSDRNITATWNVGDPYLVIKDHKTGAKVDVIKYDNQGYIAGNWSPDGRLYAFTYSKGFQGGYSTIYTVNSDGSGLQPLAQFENIKLGRPYWSPDGQKIAFVSYRGLQSRPILYQVISINTGELRTFAVDAEENLALRNGDDITWSPDSLWILFFTQEYDKDRWNYEIETLDITNGMNFCITNDNLVKVNADWR